MMPAVDAVETIRQVLSWLPTIGLRGWVIGGERHSEAAKAARCAALLAEAEAVAAAEEFLVGVHSRRTMNRNRDSYGWKGEAERWHARAGRIVYIPEGAFIVAALGRGFQADPGRDGGSVFLNISERAAQR